MNDLLMNGLPEDTLWAIIVILGLIVMLLMAELFYTRKQLQSRQKRYWWVLGASDLYMFEYDASNDELQLSEHFASLLGIPRHMFQFSQIRKLTKAPNLQYGLAKIASILEQTHEETVIRQFQLRRSDGSTGIFQVRCNSFYDKQEQLSSKVGILRDVTREVQAEEALRAKAERDSLTGVYNSGMIKKLIESQLLKQPQGRTSAFVMLDVDHFKQVNDTLGHQTGDKVLQELSRCLRTAIRDSDLIGRLGGDEFCIYLSAIPNDTYLREFCQRLNGVASKYLSRIGMGMDVTISIGGIMIHDHENFAEIYDRADKLLYGAKGEGRNTNQVIA